jgi:hypothetical protein
MVVDFTAPLCVILLKCFLDTVLTTLPPTDVTVVLLVLTMVDADAKVPNISTAMNNATTFFDIKFTPYLSKKFSLSVIDLLL